MHGSSSLFARAITRSHNAVSTVDVCDGSGQNVLAKLSIVSGSVQTDATQNTRGSCHLTFQDPDGVLVPNVATDLLQPYSGYTLKLRRGIEFPDGTVEDFPLGVFWPYNPQVTDTGDGLQITCDGYDTSKIISRSRWTQPYGIAKDTNSGTAIKNLLDTRLSGLRYNITPSTTTVPATTFGADTAQNDPWNDAQALAASDGMEVFFDANNVVVLRPIPNPDTAHVSNTYTDGASSTVIEFNRTNNGDVIYTGVVVTSEGSGVTTPIRSERWLANTNLKIPYFYATSLITTQAQADSVAAALMQQVTRGQYGVVVKAIPDPRMQVGDVIQVTRGKSKINDVFTIVQLTMPLDPETPMQITTSQRRDPG